MLAIDDHAAAETAGAKIVWGSSQNACEKTALF
jgi:hypothetical protein